MGTLKTGATDVPMVGDMGDLRDWGHGDPHGDTCGIRDPWGWGHEGMGTQRAMGTQRDGDRSDGDMKGWGHEGP